MPRLLRNYLPGYVWHITHRCHKKEFLLKFEKDRKEWIKWLFESKKRFGLSVYNYMVTSNHIHLLVKSNDETDISKSMQLIAGTTAQNYNNRKNRKGAYWENRYHATAIEDGEHLLKCMIYIDMNMVRAGVVKHPSQWDECGFKEILTPRKRYGIINHDGLLNSLELNSMAELRERYPRWLDETLHDDRIQREEIWSNSIAVGSRDYVEGIQAALGIDAISRKIEDHEGFSQLCEPESPYD